MIWAELWATDDAIAAVPSSFGSQLHWLCIAVARDSWWRRRDQLAETLDSAAQKFAPQTTRDGRGAGGAIIVVGVTVVVGGDGGAVRQTSANHELGPRVERQRPARQARGASVLCSARGGAFFIRGDKTL